MSDAIRLTDVTKRFNATAAVDRLTLAVPDGSIYGFIGWCARWCTGVGW